MSTKKQFIEPDPDAMNNRLDMAAATRFFTRAQEMSVPLVVISRFIAASQAVPYGLLAVLASHCGIIGKFVAELQQAAMQTLWRQSCLPGDGADRGVLPARCDKDWFLDTFVPVQTPKASPQMMILRSISNRSMRTVHWLCFSLCQKWSKALQWHLPLRYVLQRIWFLAGQQTKTVFPSLWSYRGFYYMAFCMVRDATSQST